VRIYVIWVLRSILSVDMSKEVSQILVRTMIFLAILVVNLVLKDLDLVLIET